jgi:hypothetical protein
MAKNVGYGSVLIVCSSSDGIAENKVAQVRSISGPGVSGNDVDTTTLDSSSNFRTFTAGLLDPGELTFAIAYDPTAVSHTRLYRYCHDRYTANWKVAEGSTGGTVTSFVGYIKGMSREIPIDDMITMDVTIKLTGKPGYTT